MYAIWYLGMIGVVASGFAGVLTGLGWYTGTHRERYIREYQIERQDLCESTLTDAERERGQIYSQRVGKNQ